MSDFPTHLDLRSPQDKVIDSAIEEITHSWRLVAATGCITSVACCFIGFSGLGITLSIIRLFGSILLSVFGVWLGWQMLRYLTAVIPLVRSGTALSVEGRNAAKYLMDHPETADAEVQTRFKLKADELRRVRLILKAGGLDA